MKIKKILFWLGGIILLLLIGAGSLYVIYVYPMKQFFKQTKTIAYDDKLTLVIGGGGNSGILQSDSLVIVIDTKMDEAAVALHDTVVKIAAGKPILVINTHVHNDHVSGNYLYKGNKIIAGAGYTKEHWVEIAGDESLPVEWLKDSMTIKMGDETVSIVNLGGHVHTVSDIIVYLHKRKMLFTGDVVLDKQCPAILEKSGSDYRGYMAAFDFMQKYFDVQHVVPGHGEVGGPEVINTYRTYFNDMIIAANDPSKESEMKAKYKDYRNIPFLMSNGATISAIRKANEK